jgi:hypothetical protein
MKLKQSACHIWRKREMQSEYAMIAYIRGRFASIKQHKEEKKNMNIETGLLAKLIGPNEEQEAMIRAKGKNFFRVAAELEKEASQQLGDKLETYVDLNKPSPLVNWAAKKRSEQCKKKVKRKIIKASRSRNRQ